MKLRISYLQCLITLSVIALSTTQVLAGITATHSWDQKIDHKGRFVILSDWDKAAVLDKETGLVWEQSPSTSAVSSWQDAQFHCNELTTGNRFGWRLPILQELASLVDTNTSGPDLPIGHPFSNVQLNFYWSATTYANATSNAWYVNFNDPSVSIAGKGDPGFFAWCVRGGQGADPQ